MILITVISVILAFMIIGSLLKGHYIFSILMILASVGLAVLNNKVDVKIHMIGQHRLFTGKGRSKSKSV